MSNIIFVRLNRITLISFYSWRSLDIIRNDATIDRSLMKGPMNQFPYLYAILSFLEPELEHTHTHTHTHVEFYTKALKMVNCYLLISNHHSNNHMNTLCKMY